MTRTFIAAALSLVLSPSSFADFNGEWLGRGKYAAQSTQTSPQIGTCNPMELTVTRTPTRFKVENPDFQCSPRPIHASPFEFELRGSRVYFEGKLVGSIVGNHLSAVVHYPEFGAHVSQEMRVTPGGVLLFDSKIWFDSGDSSRVFGQFRRVNP